MKTQYILPLAVFGLLLGLLLAVSACGDDESGDDGPGDSNGAPTDVPAAGDYGAPYSFALLGQSGEEKIEEFSCYKEMGLSFSKAVLLNDVRLIDAIDENSNFPGDPEYDTQKYNYVIDMDGNIMVAQWKSGASLGDLDQKVSNGKLIEKCQDKHCEDGRKDFPLKDLEVLVNWYPEDEEASPRQSPCWLDGDRENGLLDAISKHFMIAQGEGRTIDDFDRNRWYRWTAKEVLYAGEFIVDVKRECISDVNGDSGTYRPKRSYQTLNRVWEQFGARLSSAKICPDMR